MPAEIGSAYTQPLKNTGHRDIARKWMLGSAVLVATVMVAGMSVFTKKYVPVHGQRGNFVVLGSNSSEAVDCSTQPSEPPCYNGILFIGTAFGISTVEVLVPFIVAITFGRILGAGRQHKRLAYYLVFLLGFQILRIVKKALEPSYFDASDHVTLTMVSFAISMREFSFHVFHLDSGAPTFRLHLSAKDSKSMKFYQVCAVLVIAIQLYTLYWTTHYFHTRVESCAGFLIGLFYMLLFLFLTSPGESAGKCASLPKMMKVPKTDDEAASNTEWAFWVQLDNRNEPLLA